MSKTSRVFLSAEDLDLARRCARHATMQADPNVSDFDDDNIMLVGRENGGLSVGINVALASRKT